MKRYGRWWPFLALLPALSSCGTTPNDMAPISTTVETRPAPATLEAACTPTGLTLSAHIVSATAAGLRISVSNTGPSGTYMNFGWAGGGQGDEAPRRPTVWTLSTPPGEVQISCSTPAKEWPVQRFVVTDPQHYWSHTTMSDLGCPPGVTPGWAIPGPGRGTTAEEAVRDLLRTMTGPDWSQATQSRASIGYPEAQVQTWIVALSHGPEISVTVTTVGATFEAVPDTLCHA